MPPTLLPDSGPLITLAYARRLDLLLRPGWPLQVVDMVLHEVTRKKTPNGDAIADFVTQHQIPVIETAAFRHYHERMEAAKTGATVPNKKGLGELALQEVIHQLVLAEPSQAAVLLFEDHKIASTHFCLPESTLRVTTHAFLLTLEEKGWIDSAAEIERAAIQAGRLFSQLKKGNW
ncbi:MAG: hypothetical protein LBS89_00490 [Zoogloeaceae bacterium]|jgi:hypothetical protein|nr:hypothetical protein [Zoogloeaceae bacterium]